jgi:hypothetical protein
MYSAGTGLKLFLKPEMISSLEFLETTLVNEITVP